MSRIKGDDILTKQEALSTLVAIVICKGGVKKDDRELVCADCPWYGDGELKIVNVVIKGVVCQRHRLPCFSKTENMNELACEAIEIIRKEMIV